MRLFLLGTVAMLGWACHAQAATITEYDRGATLPDTYAPIATSSTQPYLEDQTASSADATSPFDGTQYAGRSFDAVPGNGSATFSVSSFGDSSGSTGIFTFVLGSPDTYNTFTFNLNGSAVATVTGSDLPSTPRDGYYLTQISGIGAYDSVTIGSPGADATEFAAISPVPLPASAPMFGGALVVLGALGYRLKGRKAARAIS